LASGIRGYQLEVDYCMALAKMHFENKSWQQAIVYIDQALLSLQEIPDTYKKSYKASLELVKIAAATFANQHQQELASLTEQLNSISSDERAIIHALPLVYLAEACLHSAQGNNVACSISMAKCEKCFQQQNGAIPPFIRPLANQWRNWSCVQHKILIHNLIPWRVDYASLPDRVKSKRDGKVMRLIRPGIQWNKEGKESWLYPFYMDEVPVEYSSINKYFIAKDFTIIAKEFSDNDIVAISENDAFGYSQFFDKKIPNKAELFAAWLQLEQDIEPEQWHSIEEASKGMIKRIENVLETGSPFSKDWKAEALSNVSMLKTSAAVDDNIIEDTFNTHQMLAIHENLDEFYNEEWLLSNAMLSTNYQRYFVDRIAKTPVSKEQQQRLSFFLATSPSLSIQEKIRVLNAADPIDGKSLSVQQCEQLIEVFVEERIKFEKLHKMHEDDVKKLYKRKLDDFFYLIKVTWINKVSNWHPWFVYISDPAHTDSWLNRDKQQYKIDKWYVSVDNDKPENIQPVLRCVVPIFTQKDLDDLEPIT
jgi:hypothetical protein